MVKIKVEVGKPYEVIIGNDVSDITGESTMYSAAN